MFLGVLVILSSSQFPSLVLYSKNHNQTLLVSILSQMILLCRNTKYIFQLCFGLTSSFCSWQLMAHVTTTNL